jgi:hypothetical protein
MCIKGNHTFNKRPKRACICSTGLNCKLAANTVLSTLTAKTVDIKEIWKWLCK